jgi:hypothetical protein
VFGQRLVRILGGSFAFQFVAARGATAGEVGSEVDGSAGGRRADWRFGGIECESEGPEVVGVAGFVAGGGDGDAAGGADEAFGFAEIVAEVLVDGDLEGAVFEGLEELGGERFGDSNGLGGRTEG